MGGQPDGADTCALHEKPLGTVLWSGDIRPLNIGSEYAPPEDVEGTVVLRRRTLDQLFNHNEIPLSDYVVAPHCRGSLRS